MNILVVCHYGLYQDLSFSFVHNQAREYVKLGHRVRVIIPNGFGKVRRNGKRIGKPVCFSCVDGVELCDLRYLTLSRYGDRGFNTRSAISAIRTQKAKILGDFCPDVIHAHTLGFDSEIGAWLKKKLNCPLVVTSHGSDVANPLKQGAHAWVKDKCDEADAVICVSSALREKVHSCGTKTQLEVILNGFVARALPEGIVRDPYSIIQVCNLIPLKRVDVTIRAFANLKKMHPQVKLTIIGQGPERSQLEKLCKDLDVEEAVSFLGQLPNDKVFEKLCDASYFVMVSKPEGFGIAFLEAMSAGCVAIGTKGEGIADLIVSGENGHLVPADDPDAIVRVIEGCFADRQNADLLAKAGQTAARELTWKRNAEQYIRLFSLLTLTHNKRNGVCEWPFNNC